MQCQSSTLTRPDGHPLPEGEGEKRSSCELSIIESETAVSGDRETTGRGDEPPDAKGKAHPTPEEIENWEAEEYALEHPELQPQ